MIIYVRQVRLAACLLAVVLAGVGLFVGWDVQIAQSSSSSPTPSPSPLPSAPTPVQAAFPPRGVAQAFDVPSLGLVVQRNRAGTKWDSVDADAWHQLLIVGTVLPLAVLTSLASGSPGGMASTLPCFIFVFGGPPFLLSTCFCFAFRSARANPMVPLYFLYCFGGVGFHCCRKSCQFLELYA